MGLSGIQEAALFGSWQLVSLFFFFFFLTRIVVLRFGVVASYF